MTTQLARRARRCHRSRLRRCRQLCTSCRCVVAADLESSQDRGAMHEWLKSIKTFRRAGLSADGARAAPWPYGVQSRFAAWPPSRCVFHFGFPFLAIPCVAQRGRQDFSTQRKDKEVVFATTHSGHCPSQKRSTRQMVVAADRHTSSRSQTP